MGEVHEVRCCSDTDVGWSLRSGCSVWGTSAHDGSCKNLNYAAAEAYCEAGGGRLCTRDEIRAGCTVSTGCGFDHQHVWTSTSVMAGASDGEWTPTTTESPLSGMSTTPAMEAWEEPPLHFSSTAATESAMTIAEEVVAACDPSRLEETMGECQQLCHNHMCCFEAPSCLEDEEMNCLAYSACRSLLDSQA